MTVRVVVHAEGGRETGAIAQRPAPGTALTDEQLGAAHALVRRCVVASTRVPDAAVQMLEPLRLGTGRVARGSDLLEPDAVRRLLAWPPNKRPDLAVILVDADGRTDRLARLREWTNNALLRPAIGVAIQEFEAWLISDEVAVSRALDDSFPTPPTPESMAPGEAKRLLDAAIGRSRVDGHLARRSIAAIASLELIARRSPAFREFHSDIGELLRVRS